MSLLASIFLALALFALLCYSFFRIWIYGRINALEKEVQLLIEDYKSRLTGDNRFLIDEQILRQIYSEYSVHVIKKVWIRLVESKTIIRDVMDGAWCIK